ncbi:MAG TPA: hypothetical protein VM029_12950 [Opitutaceae bacterium]|nr:hypothetical protein [Opitutaceae bacterium]
MRNFASLLVALGIFAAALPARAAEITLPPEKVKLVPSSLPGYQMALTACATCHSADYVLYQPTSSRAYWQAATVKMQKVFGAPIADDAIAPLVDYLVKTYGAEKPGGPKATPPAGKKP